jgi:hypothetical protein
MIRFVHIVNPVNVRPDSDLFTAQPITFQSIREAKRFAATTHQVELYSVQYQEDIDAVPADFIRTSNLSRSVLDIAEFRKARKLPFIQDIISLGVNAAPDGDFYIYSNADVGLMPHFYLSIARILQSGVDALAINRKTVRPHYTEISDLPMIYTELGIPHEGIDCFVFRKTHAARYIFEQAIIGSGPVGLCFVTNMLTFSKRFLWLEGSDLTFHLGDDKRWTDPVLNDYEAHNFQQLNLITQQLIDELSSFGQPAKLEFLESVVDLCQHVESGAPLRNHPKSLLTLISGMGDHSQSVLKRMPKHRDRPQLVERLCKAIKTLCR